MHPLIGFLHHQVELLESTQAMVREREGNVWITVHFLVFSATDSARSIIPLAAHNKLRAVFVLSRVVYETVVNT